MSPGTPEPRRPEEYVGVGCFTFVAGLFGGGMIALLVGLIVEGIKGCKPDPGLPICNWWGYARVGVIVGAILLPSYTIWRIRSGERAARSSNHK